MLSFLGYEGHEGAGLTAREATISGRTTRVAAAAASVSALPTSFPMLAHVLIACSVAFSPPTSKLDRRQLLANAATTLIALPMAAVADGANSKATVEKARAIYGSRVVRLQTADAATILEEKNAIKLLISGAYRAGANGNPNDKKMNAELSAIEKKILKAAKAGDSAAAQAGIKEIVLAAKLRVLDGVDGNYNPTQRRNAGAPPTSEIVAQMGTQSYALYQPLPPKK
jgi:hypothetical protein